VTPDTRLQWGAETLWEQLRELLPGLSVEIVASLPSTNTTLLERARATVAVMEPGSTRGVNVRRSVESGAFGRRAADWQPCLLVAEEQTAGRGRMGREWHAEPLASLTFSLAIPLAPVDWSGLSLAVGIAVAEALDPPSAQAPLRIGLKWPNDLWLLDDTSSDPAIAPGRKLGGILIETVASGPRRLAVIGIGLNISQPPPLRPQQTTSGFAWLREIDPAVDAPQALGRIALPLVRTLREFERTGFAAFADRYAARDLLRDRPVTTTQAEAATGIARGVGPDGGLEIELANGHRMTLRSGEVSVRPRGLPAPSASEH
jgi:BirA family transcriptional regulator, biotin operon repressor / biotin---[acetyl-CoA-carboxylase] ligase